MAGRPGLRIGQHGKIARTNLGGGVWVARCRYRDVDGVVRLVERRGPADEQDYRGKLAEDYLIEALAHRRLSSTADELDQETLVMTLVCRHIDRLAEDGRAIRTIDTYRYDASKLAKLMGGVRVAEATPARLDAALRSMRNAHGPTMARRARTLLKGGLQLAVLQNVLASNPVRDVGTIRSRNKPSGAAGLSADQLSELWEKLLTSDNCRKRDLSDAMTILIATGLRRSELLALRWSDFDSTAGTLTVSGKLVRQRGHGLVRVDEAKTAAGMRTVSLPAFAVDTLNQRRTLPYLGEQRVVFPSTAGGFRDPDNFNSQWRAARNELGVPDVTSHTFRKSLATLIDDAGLSALVGADQLGHAKVSMTQDRYMQRGRVHSEVADLLDRTVRRINDE
jgi:integrase